MRAGITFSLFVCLAAHLTADTEQRPAAGGTPPRASEMQKAVEEFRSQTRNLGLRPDSPRKRAAANGVASKFHGRLYENFRNDFLDAVPHELVQRGESKNLLRRNQFGFNVAGPVFLPKIFDGSRTTFFSVSYEGMREKISRSNLRTVATLPERLGDFSETVDLSGNPLPIFDPATTRANRNFDPAQPVTLDNLQYLRDPFPGNRIPSGRLDPVALADLREYPLPNTNVGPFFRNNYFFVSPETNTANGMIFKLDHTVREKHRIESSAAYSNGFAGSARVYPTIADPNPADRQFQSRRAGVQHIWTLSPKTVHSLEVEATTDSSRNASNAFPAYRMESYAPMGRANPLLRSTRNSFGIGSGFSTRLGKHSVRFTSGALHQQLHAFTETYPEGLFRFGSGLTSLPGIVNTGHSFASFVLGLSERAERSLVTSPSYFRRNRFNVQARDNWEVRRGLTLSGSLNFEVVRPRTEKYDRLSTVDLHEINPANGRPGALIVAGENGVGSGFEPVRMNWEPSVSIAWNPGGGTRTVVRTAYSRSYGGSGLASGQWGTQAFNASPTYISPNLQLEPAVTLRNGLPPAPELPDTRPDALNNMVADLIDRTERQPRTQAASLSVQRELPWMLVATAGAYHYDGKNMLAGNEGVNANGIHLDHLVYRDQLNNELFRRSLRPYPQYVGFDLNWQYPVGRYTRDAAWLRVEKRTSAGLGLTAYYEYGKQLDDYTGPYGVQDPYNRDNEWARTVGRPPQVLTLSYVYELPLGPGRPLFAWTDWRRYFVEGWSLSGMTTMNSGDPLYLRPQFNNTGGVVDALNVNVVPGIDPRVADPGPDLWFNPAAFAQPADFSIGNASRTHPYLLQPGTQNHDLSVTKRFSLTADRAVELSAVGFNFVNYGNWNDPDMVIGPDSAPNVNAGRIIGSRGGRVIQLGVRYSF
jgi:hypothetical protein